MNARTLRLLCVVLVSGCVLPDYEVGGATEGSASRDKQDAGGGTRDSGMTSKDQRAAVQALAGADEDCERCVIDHCQAERSECGDDCARLEWPVSPAWKVTDRAESFVKCLAMQCEDTCKVSWGCSDNYSLPQPRADFPVTIRVTAAVSGYQIDGAKVTACQGLDPSCADNVGSVSASVTNGTGEAVVTLPRGFDGYFLVDVEKEQANGATYVPMTVKWSEQVFRTEASLTVSMFEPALIEALAVGVEKIEAGKGNFIFKAQNCLPEPFVGEVGANASADGVVISYTSLGKKSQVYYVTSGFAIDRNLTATSVAGGGFGGVFNVTPGPVSVTGVHEGEGVTTGGFPMRANTLGAIFLLPKAKR
jgi:hypothetical protein